ncbi:MAG: DUF2779 domain-containing protein [Planctomycetes bacterium]|nr:DUF2779 domain-containing protein [Planctomycetota bacterium]
MKKTAKQDSVRPLDKPLFEAGQQCLKRLYLDAHEPTDIELSDVRKALAEAGQQLIELARGAFPKGVAIKAQDHGKAVAETKAAIEAQTPIVFGAAFAAGDVQVRCDILLVQKAGLDVYEVKSGTKVKPRYIADLALQTQTIEQAGFTVRAAFLLHLNPKYVHKAGAELLPLQLFKNADVTAKVRQMLPRVQEQLGAFRAQMDDDGALQLPMGTWCTTPFPCPHLARCTKEGPAHPLRELPDLTRQQESMLHEEAIDEIGKLDPRRSGLTFRQRRTVQCVVQNALAVEPFVREELRSVEFPLHFLTTIGVTEALPKFDGQRPWRQLPYGWAVQTLYQDGRVEPGAFVFADREDPRPGFVTSLAKHFDIGGMLVVWGHRTHDMLRMLLEDVPEHKAGIRAALARPHIDLLRLLESGVFHPDLHGQYDLKVVARVLLDDKSGDELTIGNDDQVTVALQKACTPRVRAATKEKLGAELQAFATWQSQTMLALYRHFGRAADQPAPVAKPATAPTARPAPKPLPPQKALPRTGDDDDGPSRR